LYKKAAAVKKINKIDNWGEFYQHAFVPVQLLLTQILCHLTSISPTMLCSTLPRSQAQLLRYMLYSVCQYDQLKSTGAKDANRLLMKWTSVINFTNWQVLHRYSFGQKITKPNYN